MGEFLSSYAIPLTALGMGFFVWCVDRFWNRDASDDAAQHEEIVQLKLRLDEMRSELDAIKRDQVLRRLAKQEMPVSKFTEHMALLREGTLLSRPTIDIVLPQIVTRLSAK